MKRRQFAFWLGMGLFGLSERLGADSLDRLASLAMRATEPVGPNKTAEHWTIGENSAWRWFERETLIDGKWKLTGITTPINKRTGARYTEKTGYLPDELVPVHVRRGKTSENDLAERVDRSNGAESAMEPDAGEPSPSRRARHGRPPSRWLRSLNSDELRVWLETIDVPEAGVSGMTFWTHLTRDHSFAPLRIEGLSEPELAKLHAAAHYGY